MEIETFTKGFFGDKILKRSSGKKISGASRSDSFNFLIQKLFFLFASLIEKKKFSIAVRYRLS